VISVVKDGIEAVAIHVRVVAQQVVIPRVGGGDLGVVDQPDREDLLACVGVRCGAQEARGRGNPGKRLDTCSLNCII
jgi:hypothetical protein